MNETKRHITYLLENRGIVGIPGIGTFTCHRRPASFDGVRLLPPGTTVAFECDAENGDDVDLQHSVMLRSGIDSEQAFATIQQGIGDIRHDLNFKGESNIDEIGTIRQNEGVLSFEQNSGWSGPVFSYPEISLEPINVNKEESSAADENEMELRRQRMMRSLRRTASSAAAIAVFAFLTFIIAQLPRGRHNNSTQASFGIEQSQPVTTFATTNPASRGNESLILIFNTPADASSEVVYDKTPEETVIAEQNAYSGRYCLVVASLANSAEAARYMANAPADVKMLQKDGRYRAYIMEAATAEELMQKAKAADIYNTYPSAWVCRK